MKVPHLHRSDDPTPVMAGGLGLAAASVSTAHSAFKVVLIIYTRWKGH